jgi:hypothetical protein
MKYVSFAGPTVWQKHMILKSMNEHYMQVIIHQQKLLVVKKYLYIQDSVV